VRGQDDGDPVASASYLITFGAAMTATTSEYTGLDAPDLMGSHAGWTLRLLSAGALANTPGISRDGRWVVFRHSDSNGNDPKVSVYDLQEATLTTATDVTTAYQLGSGPAAMSADGQKILLHVGQLTQPGLRLWSLPATTTTSLLNVAGRRSPRYPKHPRTPI